MDTIRTRRVAGATLVLAAALLCQACAVTTGQFIPSRASRTNNNMTSHFDVTRAHSAALTPHAVMSTTHEKGYLDFKYY